MISFTLNGIPRREAHDRNLLTYLREDRHLTSVKNGCAEGACGTCTVLIDGIAKKACVYKLSRMEGRQIVTLEGLSEREKNIYGYAFAKCGAVQCGFCIPGMVLCAKGLIDRNPTPSPQDVKKAIRGNLCRCTGYVKIEQAILLAADLLAGRAGMEGDEEARLGASCMRIDAYAKATGTAQYCDDLFLDGMLHGKVLRSAYPRAKILSIDTEKAKTYPGVAAVLTAADIPGSNIDGYMIHDTPTMIPVGAFTHCVGDALAIVAAETPEIAQKAIALIDVQYEVHTPITNVREAMARDAPKLFEQGNLLTHNHLRVGDPDAAFRDAACEVTVNVALPGTDHAFLEPESSTACYGGETMIVYTTSQSVYHNKHALCRILALQDHELQVRACYVGGGFGGKEDLHVQHFAALLCRATKRPVKVTATRFESMCFHPKRHPMEIEYSLCCDAAGNFLAAKATILSDTGAYASLGTAVIGRACTHTGGPYRTKSFEVNGYAYYTNNPPYGAFRGFGVTQMNFATETAVDRLAEKLGRDKLELRLQNALRPGDTMPTGQLCGDDVAFYETLKAVEPAYRQALAEGKHAGVAGALKNVGLGSGIPDHGRARLDIRGGRILLQTAAQCLGQGLSTTMIQIAAEVLQLPGALFEAIRPNTETTPDAGATTASRQTTITGNAVKLAAEKMKAALEGHTLEDLEGQSFAAEYDPPTQPINAPGIDHPVSQIAYGYAANAVVLGRDGRIEKIVAAHDVGRCINRKNVEGQIEGGVVMAMGYALTEDFIVEGGYVKQRYGTLGLLRATDIPPIEVIIVEKNTDPLAFGAKGVGEIAAIPTTYAIAAAYRSKNGDYEYALPLKKTPYARAK